MIWWCSATGAPWTWVWRPYLGVWLLATMLLVFFFSIVRPARIKSGATSAAGETAWFVLGTATLWVATDWPLGTLGAGYLLTAHTVTYILLSLAAAPLLLLGIGPWVAQRFAGSPGVMRALRFWAGPLPGLATFNTALIVTHLPDVVDGLGRSQAGTFVVDMTWLVTGMMLWWPVVAPQPSVGRLSNPVKMGYLFLATIVPTIPAAFLTFSDYPLYALYELAPRALNFPATTDQQVAGLTMKLIGDLPLWLGFGLVFFRWAREEERSSKAPPPAPDRPVPVPARR